MDIGEFRGIFHEQNLTFLAQTPYVYHCHHYNLFHDQTIDDALGEDEGALVRTHAARNAARELIDGVCIRAGATTPLERIQVAAELFAWMGQGKLDLALGDHGGSARSSSFHYGHSWVEKYGKKVRREYPCDAVAAGFAAAALEIARARAWERWFASRRRRTTRSCSSPAPGVHRSVCTTRPKPRRAGTPRRR